MARLSTRYLLAVAGVAVIVIGLLAVNYSRRGGGVAVEPPPLPRFLEGSRELLEVSSSAFQRGGRIPVKYTCDGEDVSPEIRVAGVPPEAKSLVLIVYDPDAPIGWFTHWLLYDIPSSRTVIPENVPKRVGRVEGLGLQGVNDFGYIGYGGPCPPRGHGVHRYVFLVLALDTPSLGLDPGANYHQVVEAVKGHIIGYGYTYGVYSR